MSRDIDQLIDYINCDLRNVTDVERQLLINRVNVRPTDAERDNARNDLDEALRREAEQWTVHHAARPVIDPPTNSPDAMKWAESFVSYARRTPDIATDAGTMVGWFANAMGAGERSRCEGNRAARVVESSPSDHYVVNYGETV